MGARMLRKGLAVIVILLFVGMSVVPSTGIISKQSSKPILFGVTFYVGGTGPNNYTKIQDAIDNASNRDIVFVYNGTYYENVVVNKILDIIGEDRNFTIIDGNGSGDVVYVTGYLVSITGFTIQNSGDNTQSGIPDAGIYINSYGSEIIGNNIWNNRGGVFVYYSSTNNLISDNIIINNKGDGIYLYHASGGTTISDNIISNNNQQGAYQRGGIWMDQSNNNVISGNIISNNSGWANILMANSCDNNNISGNFIRNHSKGMYIYPSCNDNIISNNWIKNNYDGIYIKLLNVDNLITNNLFLDNYYGIRFDAYSSIDNNIYHNNFINNEINAKDPYNNNWNDSYPSGGNYWDDYTGDDVFSGPGQNISGFDGIGDTPYIISGGSNQDNYPLMNPWNNNPPETPDIDGPPSGAAGEEYEYTFFTTDPDEGDIWYFVDWDDGSFEEWIGPYPSGQEVVVSHTWNEQDTYLIKAKAKDIFNIESEWSDPFIIEIFQGPPNKPTIIGPTDGNAGQSYIYTFVSSDPESHDVRYYIDWGDDTYEDWIGPYDSGEEVVVSHIWGEEDTYTIQAKSKDEFDAESDWAYLEVTMPVNQQYNFPLLQRLLERFPNAFPILRYLIEAQY